jgi:cytochrome c556
MSTYWIYSNLQSENYLMKMKIALGLLSISLIGGAAAAQFKPEDAIKFRQSAYTTMAWNMSRIKANITGTYNKDEVIKAANVIQAIANSGLGTLYMPGTDKGRGWVETRVKSESFTDTEGVEEVAVAFNKEANEIAKVAATGDVAAVNAQFDKLGKSCKGCHDKYRVDE